jgi:hypothetical protein
MKQRTHVRQPWTVMAKELPTAAAPLLFVIVFSAMRGEFNRTQSGNDQLINKNLADCQQLDVFGPNQFVVLHSG